MHVYLAISLMIAPHDLRGRHVIWWNKCITYIVVIYGVHATSRMALCVVLVRSLVLPIRVTCHRNIILLFINVVRGHGPRPTAYIQTFSPSREKTQYEYSKTIRLDTFQSSYISVQFLAIWERCNKCIFSGWEIFTMAKTQCLAEIRNGTSS